MSVNFVSFAERYPILLVLDANVLVAELLKRRGQALIADPRLQLIITECAWSETQHELARRVRARSQYDSSIASAVTKAITQAIDFAERFVERVPQTLYEDLLSEAARRIPDPQDVPTAALAIATNAAILTEDAHFWGGGLRIWRIQRLLSYLAIL